MAAPQPPAGANFDALFGSITDLAARLNLDRESVFDPYAELPWCLRDREEHHIATIRAGEAANNPDPRFRAPTGWDSFWIKVSDADAFFTALSNPQFVEELGRGELFIYLMPSIPLDDVHTISERMKKEDMRFQLYQYCNNELVTHKLNAFNVAKRLLDDINDALRFLELDQAGLTVVLEPRQKNEADMRTLYQQASADYQLAKSSGDEQEASRMLMAALTAGARLNLARGLSIVTGGAAAVIRNGHETLVTLRENLENAMRRPSFMGCTPIETVPFNPEEEKKRPAIVLEEEEDLFDEDEEEEEEEEEDDEEEESEDEED